MSKTIAIESPVAVKLPVAVAYAIAVAKPVAIQKAVSVVDTITVFFTVAVCDTSAVSGAFTDIKAHTGAMAVASVECTWVGNLWVCDWSGQGGKSSGGKRQDDKTEKFHDKWTLIETGELLIMKNGCMFLGARGS